MILSPYSRYSPFIPLKVLQGPTLYYAELLAFQLDSFDERWAGTVGNREYTYEDPPPLSI